MNTVATSHTANGLAMPPAPGLVMTIVQSLSQLTYDGRAEVLASLVAIHALANTDPENTAWDEAGAIASAAREIICQANNEPAGGNHAARS